MIKFGAMNCPGTNPISEIRRIARQGFDFIDFTIESKSRIEYLNLKKIKKEIEKAELGIIGSTDWRIQHASPYNGIRRASRNEILKEISFLSKLGARIITVHYDNHSSGIKFESDRILKRNIESFKLFSKAANRTGTKIVVENYCGTNEHINEIGILLKKVPDIYFHLDIGHANLSGGDKAIKKFINRYKKRIIHIHVSDNHGDWDEHLGIGQGNIDWKLVIKLLKKIKYDKTITLETFNPKSALTTSFKKMKKLLRLKGSS